MLSRPHPACEEVRRELEAFALRQLCDRDAALLRRHLARCPGCARSAEEVSGIIHVLSGLSAPRKPRFRADVAIAAAAAACVLVVLIRFPAAAPALRLGADDGCALRSPGVVELVATQAPDGSWREAGPGSSPVHPIGLSALAALGCLAVDADAGSDAARAARQGCDFLVRALEDRNPEADGDLSPDLGLRSHAVAAWALGVAAKRWPGLYRRAAVQALRDLAAREDSWEGGGEAPATSPLTRELLACAWHAAGEAGLAGPRRTSGPSPIGAARVAGFASSEVSAAANRVTRLASRVLADALPPDRGAF